MSIKCTRVAVLFLLLISSSKIYAQDTTIKIQNSKVVIAGYKKSTIKMVNYANKPLGNMVTYTAFNSKEVVATFYVSSKEQGVYLTYVQTIPIENAKRLIADVTAIKSTPNPEENTSPKQYWEVSMAFKKKNGEYQNIGTTTEYRISYDGTPKMTKETYEGTQRLIPFITKKAADEFVANIKLALNTK